jgi:hypothetical protein
MAKETILARGVVTDSDELVVELIKPDNAPQMILVRWPDHPTMISPRRFADTASAIARLFARASTELARIRAGKL